MNGKFKQIPNAEHLPEPAFEMTLSDFPKLQDLESNNLLDLQKHAWGPVGSAEGDKLPLTPPGKLAISNITKEVSHWIVFEMLNIEVLIRNHLLISTTANFY